MDLMFFLDSITSKGYTTLDGMNTQKYTSKIFYGAFWALLIIEGALACRLLQSLSLMAEPQFVAFVRVKNEIKTIHACLDSIDGIFDRIVIIHSNEPDDGSVAFMRQWCRPERSCEIHEYPHAVIPANDRRIKENPKWENTLAAYYEFGLKFFNPEDWVVKIDADQIYITETLRQTIQSLKRTLIGRDKYLLGLWGYNTLPRQGTLLKYKATPKNGLEFDHYIVKRKHIMGFEQKPYYEQIKLKKLKRHRIRKGHWFHFSKSYKKNYQRTPSDQVPLDKLTTLSAFEKGLYQQHILPLLINTQSPYARLRY